MVSGEEVEVETLRCARERMKGERRESLDECDKAVSENLRVVGQRPNPGRSDCIT